MAFAAGSCERPAPPATSELNFPMACGASWTRRAADDEPPGIGWRDPGNNGDAAGPGDHASRQAFFSAIDGVERA